MRTMRWFFSLGIARQSASYVLTDDVVRRLREWFPGVRVGSTHSAQSATAGILHLLGPPADGVTVSFHLMPTDDVLKHGHLDTCVEESPEWARGEMERARRFAPLGARDPDTISKVVGRALEEVSALDVVFFETTNGLRPFAAGLLLAQSVVRALRPGVSIAAAVYAELNPGQPCPVYDLTEFLDLPLWATAAANLRRRLDANDLAALVETSHPGLAAPLRDFGSALDLGWPDDLVNPLAAVRSALQGATVAATPGQAAVLQLAADELEGLAKGIQPSPALNVSLLRFHIDVAKKLAGGRRYGDAVRVLREAMVDAAVLEGAGKLNVPPSEWLDPKRRRLAEAKLSRGSKHDLENLWKKVTGLRNAASHAKANLRHGSTQPAKLLEAMGQGKGPIFVEVDRVLFDDKGLRAELFTSHAPRGCPWFLGPNLVAPPQREPKGVALAPPGQEDDVVVVAAKLGKRRGMGWATKLAKKARGATDAVLFLPGQTGDLVLLARALEELGIRPWVWEGGVFVQAFAGAG